MSSAQAPASRPCAPPSPRWPAPSWQTWCVAIAAFGANAMAKRLANLIAEPDAPVPHDVAVAVEESLGRLLDALDVGE